MNILTPKGGLVSYILLSIAFLFFHSCTKMDLQSGNNQINSNSFDNSTRLMGITGGALPDFEPHDEDSV